MHGAAVAWNELCARIFALKQMDCLSLRHSGRHGKIQPIAASVRAVAGFCQTLGNQAVLMPLRSESAGWREAHFLEIGDRVEAHIKSHPALVTPDLLFHLASQQIEVQRRQQHRGRRSAGRRRCH